MGVAGTTGAHPASKQQKGGVRERPTGFAFLSPSAAHADPLAILREVLVLSRRAGFRWFSAYPVARELALQVVADRDERDAWSVVISDTCTTWMRAYERRPTGCRL